jgi:S-adenosylmethionine hydrolase
MAGPITLLTDFGTRDTYVGQMKGVILALHPGCALVDLTHEIGPQQIEEGAFHLEAAIGAFPAGTVHLAVVDPGVGTARRSIAISTPSACFVGPDNGLLSAALPERSRPPEGGAALVPLSEGMRAVELEPARYGRGAISNTFHGRDVFAPAAALLAAGHPLEALGRPIDAVLALPPIRARRLQDGRLAARVVSIDRFGNVITSCRAEQLSPGPFKALVAGQSPIPSVRSYGDAPPGSLVCLIGSSGFVEVARVNGSAAGVLGAVIGDEVIIAPG